MRQGRIIPDGPILAAPVRGRPQDKRGIPQDAKGIPGKARRARGADRTTTGFAANPIAGACGAR